MNVLKGLVVAFILVCPIFAVILWFTSSLSRRFSINSIFLKHYRRFNWISDFLFLDAHYGGRIDRWNY